MQDLSSKLEFEKAASVRDKLIAIETLREKQKIFSVTEADEDFINIYKDEKDACVQVFFVRDGKISGREHTIIENTAFEHNETIISQFIVNYYGGTAKAAKVIYVPEAEDIENLEWNTHFLTDQREEEEITYEKGRCGRSIICACSVCNAYCTDSFFAS